MHSEKIESLFKYFEFIETLHSTSSLIYRGQSVYRKLLPAIARSDPKQNKTESEKEMLKEMRRIGYAQIQNSHALSELDLLVMAQHYGMKTRLLDWTSNPLSALWFACSDKMKGDVYVYVLIADPFVSVPDSNAPFDNNKTYVFKPNFSNPRISAQSGWFTVHPFLKKSGRYVALDKNTSIKSAIFEMKIPESSRSGMLKSLDKYGVNNRSLFPDVEGTCRYLNWVYGA